MRYRYRSVVVVFLLALGCAAPEVDVVTVTVGRVSVEVPAPDTRVWSEVFFDDGTFESVAVLTDEDGELTIDDGEASSLGPLAQAQCSDDARSLLGFHWETPLEWWFNA